MAPRWLGAVAAPIVHIYGSRETGYILGQCRPKVHVTASRFGHQDFLANLERSRSCPISNWWSLDGNVPSGGLPVLDLLDEDPIDSPVRVDPASPALIGWTSGTTSNPKGVIHSHADGVRRDPTTGRDVSPFRIPDLIANPISHAIGMLGALLIPIDRGQSRSPPRPVGSGDGARSHHHGGTQLRWRRSLFLDEPLGPSGLHGGAPGPTEYQGMGGAPVPRVIMERATDLGIIIYKMYGSTEHPSITGCTVSPISSRSDSH